MSLPSLLSAWRLLTRQLYLAHADSCWASAFKGESSVLLSISIQLLLQNLKIKENIFSPSVSVGDKLRLKPQVHTPSQILYIHAHLGFSEFSITWRCSSILAAGISNARSTRSQTWRAACVLSLFLIYS